MKMRQVDYAAIARDVYALVGKNDPLAAPVKEALEVIDEAFETWGYVGQPRRTWRTLTVSAARSMCP